MYTFTKPGAIRQSLPLPSIVWTHVWERLCVTCVLTSLRADRPTDRFQ